MPQRIRIIANPTAGRGRAERLLPAVRAAFRAVGVEDVWLTSAPGDEGALVHRALDEGATTIALLGGDGTWSKATAVVVARRAQCRIAFINGGTGNDFTRNLPVPADDPAAMARLALEGPERRVDTGVVDGAHFLNVVGFGFDTAVLADMERIPLLRGDALYHAAALRQLFRYPGVEVELGGDAAPLAAPRRQLLVAVANGRFFGGSFRIAPDALPDDGKLDLVAIGDASPLKRARLFMAAPHGRHLRFPGVLTTRGESFLLRFPAPPLYDLDGELRHARYADVEVAVVRGALRVVTSPTGASPGRPSGSAS